jgi:molecular chaperone DnaJ
VVQGRVIKTPCKDCNGAGRVEREKQMEVKIPAVSKLVLVCECKAKAKLERRADLPEISTWLSTLPSTSSLSDKVATSMRLSDYFCSGSFGRDIMVKTLDGDEKLKVPMGTQTGTVFRLKGKGMPQLGGRGKGDLFVSVSVITPTSLTREQRKLLEQLAEVENKDLEDKGLVDKVRDIFG